MAENPADTCIVKRSRRKTLSLEITPEGKLIIRAPLRASDEEILSFARSHREWIADKIREAASRKQQREEYERRHHIRPLTRAELKELGKAAAEYIPMRAAHYAAIMGVDFNRITIRNQTTRWGSCSAKKNLNFNALLMLTPGEVIDSVIVIPLCLVSLTEARTLSTWITLRPSMPRYCASIRIIANGTGGLRRTASC